MSFSINAKRNSNIPFDRAAETSIPKQRLNETMRSYECGKI